MRRVVTPILITTCLLAGAFSGPATADATADAARADLRSRAANGYETGDCAAVLSALSELEAGGGTLEGVDEYRRGFCLYRTRQAGSEDSYRLAAALLGATAAGADPVPIGTHFYRVNALLNLQRFDDAEAAAEYAVERWKKGELVVAQDEPDDWFRLGKLFRDAGQNEGAIEPFSRALVSSEKSGKELRSAYLQRIARAAREAGDVKLATRAAEMDAATGEAGPERRFRAGRALVTKGDYKAAYETFLALRRVGGELGMKAQYASESVERVVELSKWNRRPVAALPDGRAVASLELGELQAELFGIARQAATLLAEGEYRMKARKNGEGLHLVATPEVTDELRDTQARLAGLLLEAVQRDAPIREWAVSGGFANMVHMPLTRLFRRQASTRADSAGESPVSPE